MLAYFLACSTADVEPVVGAAPVTTAPEPPPAAEPEIPTPIVMAARQYMGRPYRFGGRGAQLDCMGLVFLAWADATGGNWRKLSVNPTRIVARRQLGPAVESLAGVPTERIDWDLLKPGDVIFLLGPTQNPAEPAIATVDGVPEWVWHMGLYSGGAERRFVVGDHFHGRVSELALPAYLTRYADWYDAIFVTRPAAR
ncbi:MAG: hypothetical protein Q8P18_20965 [Pseudomonadota bacterium]|nr:hypothetical protein [Pseudomonadota bacterium]